MNNIATDTKRIVIKKVNGKEPPQEMMIAPGVTAGDVLRNMGLLNQGFILTGSEASDTFGMDEPLYGRVQDGQLLHASSELSAGNAA